MPRKPCEKSVHIVNLKQIASNRYGFALSIGAWLVRGFTYNPDNKSMQMPYFVAGGKRVPQVRTFGIHIKRLSVELDEMIAEHQEQMRENYERRRSEEISGKTRWGKRAGDSE